jgi:hypothetical protein
MLITICKITGVHEQKHVDFGLHLWYRFEVFSTVELEGTSMTAIKQIIDDECDTVLSAILANDRVSNMLQAVRFLACK